MDDRGDDVGEDEDGNHRRDIHHAHSGDDAAERSKDRFRDGEEELGDWVAGADVGKPGKYGPKENGHAQDVGSSRNDCRDHLLFWAPPRALLLLKVAT